VVSDPGEAGFGNLFPAGPRQILEARQGIDIAAARTGIFLPWHEPVGLCGRVFEVWNHLYIFDLFS
jgi:hypothetical protein